MVICLEWCADLQCIWPSWCHYHSLSLAPVKSRLVLPFWYRLTWVVPDKGPLNGYVFWHFGMLLAGYLQDGRSEFRYGLEVQHTSVQKQTHLLCPFPFQFSLETINCLCFAITELLSSIFHLDTTRWEKKYFLISLLHRHLTSFNECPRVLPVVSIWNISVNGIAEKPWAILKTSIKSARFRRSSKVHSPSFCNLASYCYDLRLVIIRVNLCCTFSRSFFILLIMWRPSRYAVF